MVLEALIKKTKSDATIHVARRGVVDVKLDKTSRAQFELEIQLDAAKLLCDAKVDTIVWGGTSASWLGIENDPVSYTHLRAHET